MNLPDNDDEAAGAQDGKPAGRVVMLPGKRRDETEEQANARTLVESDLNTAMTLERLRPSALSVDIVPLMEALAAQSAAVKAGEEKGERVLADQAAVLDALFNNLTRRAMANVDAGYVESGERFLRLAFKAQSQCRMNWEAIGEIRNPRQVAFVRADQANVACGPQQVNNAGAREKLIPPTELNGAADEQAMDAGSTTPAIGANQTVAALGALDGATIPKGQGAVISERVQGKHSRVAAPGRKATPGD
jgi:hypothetical protein